MTELITPKKAAMISLAVVIALYSVCLLVYDLTWAINDDAVMAMTVSGKGFVDRPTEYFAISNILLGMSLKMLFAFSPAVPWYGIYTIAVLFVSSAALLYVMLLKGYSIERLIFFLVFFSLFGLYGFMHPQFTVNAFMLAAAGVFLFLQRLEGGPARGRGLYPISALFLFAGSLVRINSMLLAVVMAVPSLLTAVVLRRREYPELKKAGYWFAIIVLVVAAAASYDSYCYSSDEWKYAFDRARYRSEMIDNNKMAEYSDRTKPIFKELGWGLNDFLIMKRWFFLDDEVMSYDKAAGFISRIKAVPTGRPLIHFVLLLEDPKLYLALLMLIIVWYKAPAAADRELQAVLLTFIAALCIIFCLGYFFRLPERVASCILAFISFTAVYRADFGPATGSVRRRPYLRTAAAVLLGVIAIGWLSKADREWRREAELFRQEASVLQLLKDRLYLIWGHGFPFELMSVFDSLDMFSGRALIGTYGGLKIPTNHEILRRFSIDKFRDIVSNEKVYHVGKPPDMALYSRYLKDHYGIDAYFRIITETPLFFIFSQHTVTPEVEGKLISAHVPVGSFVYEVRLLR